MTRQRTYIAIDLKSFYASVECVERGLDPLKALLVVADESRTDKTICLAVSPALKAYGTGGRPRLFEVRQKARGVNFIIARPRMEHYIFYSTRIFQIYLKYVAPEDIHSYSIDEVFMDVTDYLATYKMTARELTIKIIRDVLQQTGITATVGIGTNMYLAKIAMDIVAKHIPADKDGVRIAELDEMSYRRQLWNHTPITDFWRVGHGIAARLEQYNIHTMGEIARVSLENEDVFYKLFGVNAELLIDHAWGREPATMAQVKAYKPESHSLSSGQVLSEPYTVKKARVVIAEMAEGMAYQLLSGGHVTDQIVLDIGYDIECLKNPEIARTYKGEIYLDHYGRQVPKPAHGSTQLGKYTFSARCLKEKTEELFDRIITPNFLIRRMNLSVMHVITEEQSLQQPRQEQLDLFADYEELAKRRERERAELEKERKLMTAYLAMNKRFGKNALFKGLNLEEGATGLERNKQIGGHKA